MTVHGSGRHGSARTTSEELEGTIERLVPGGRGLLRADDGVVFVDDVIAGERVRVVIRGTRGGARHATLRAVLSASSERVVPPCPRAHTCGGCDWLHLSRAEQTRSKEAIVDDALVRVGRFAREDVASFRRPLRAPADAAGAARRRARLAVDESGGCGFFARASHRVVVADDCAALDVRLRAVLARLADAPVRLRGRALRLAIDDRGHVAAAVDRADDARALVAAGIVHGALVPAPSDGDPGRDVVVGDVVLVGEVTAGALPAHSDPASFTQATRFGGRAILDEVLAACDDVRGTRVLELFAGAGHLTLPLADRGAHVDAVEGDPRGHRFLIDNARQLRLAARVRARRGYIDDRLPLPDSIDVVVADPPRTGIPGAARLFLRLASSGARRVVLVSCDPATGARDLRAAVDAGFGIERLVPIDAFPGTHHVEWVAALRRAV